MFILKSETRLSKFSLRSSVYKYEHAMGENGDVVMTSWEQAVSIFFQIFEVTNVLNEIFVVMDNEDNLNGLKMLFEIPW